jgi:hypothetical protein
VIQVEADRATRVRFRIDYYERGWHGARARISVLDRDGAPLLTLPAIIRHWPFTSGGLMDWVAEPELTPAARAALGPWGAQLPELTTRTQLSWRGDLRTELESSAFKRRVPEVPGGMLEVAPASGVFEWRKDGALTFELNLPELRIERMPLGRSDGPDLTLFQEARLSGNGSLGTNERLWNQKASLSAASATISEAGTVTFSATRPTFTVASDDDGERVALHMGAVASTITARSAWQNLSETTVEFTVDVKQLTKEPLGRILDALPGADNRDTLLEPQFKQLWADLLRGSPNAELRFMLKAKEGHADLKLGLAFDGLSLEPNYSSDTFLRRLGAELDARATLALVISGTRAGASMVADALQPSRRVVGGSAPADVTAEQDALARQRLADAVAQGWVRIEGDDVAVTAAWRDGQLTLNGHNMNALRDLARGMAGR